MNQRRSDRQIDATNNNNNNNDDDDDDDDNNNKIIIIHAFSIALFPVVRAQRACSHTCTNIYHLHLLT